MNFQKMLDTNLSCTGYATLSVDTKIHSFSAKMISYCISSKVKTLCKYIKLEVHCILTLTSENDNQTQSFEQKIIASMQTPMNSLFDKLFKEHYSDLYDETIVNRCCRFILVNARKHCLTEEWVPSVINEYKKRKNHLRVTNHYYFGNFGYHPSSK